MSRDGASLFGDGTSRIAATLALRFVAFGRMSRAVFLASRGFVRRGNFLKPMRSCCVFDLECVVFASRVPIAVLQLSGVR